jgi:hypothetical protein
VDWWSYVKEVAGDKTSTHKIAEAMNDGTSPATVNRWKSGVRPDADKVVSLCRGYGENPIIGLVRAGYVTAKEAAAYRLAVTSIEDLFAEMQTLTEQQARGTAPADSADRIAEIQEEIERRTERRRR